MKQNYFPPLSPQLWLFLVLIAVGYAGAMTILVIFRSEAAPSTGRVPSLAISLVSEVNTGILGPYEQRWFKLTPNGVTANGQTQQALTMFFTLNEGTKQRQVSLQLFDESQLPYYYDGLSDQMINFGAGQPVSRDNNPASGELIWTGWLLSGQDYYVQLRNDNSIPLDYWLLTDDVMAYSLDQLETTEQVAIIEPLASGATPNNGTTPYTAVPLEGERHTGHLNPGRERWYSFSRSEQDDLYFEETAFTMFATPNTAQQIERMTFEIFTADEVRRGSQQGNSVMNNVGGGSLVHRDNDPLTGERFWTGWVVDGDLYYLRVQNHTVEGLDYWLFTGDIYNPILGEN